MKVEERVQPGRDVQAGGRLAQHGLDQFRALSPCRQIQGVQVRLGEAASGGDARPASSATRFKDIEYILATCYDNGTRFEFECYDIAHLYNLAHFADRGLVKPPFFVQSVFGILGGIGTHPEDVAHMKRTADRLFGDNYRWSVLGAGASQLRIAAQAAAMGGNIRVGLEDSLWAGKGKLAQRPMPSRCCSPARSSKGSAWRSRRPTRRARSCSSRAATRSRSRRRGMLRIEVFSEDRNQLGEGPLWDVEEQRLYWIDSYAPAVYSC